MNPDGSLAGVAAFLARRWSGCPQITARVTSRRGRPTKPGESVAVVLPPGGGLDAYREFRVSLWYESMRASMCERVLSGDHAFGAILNAMETRRIEALGRRVWRGMDGEIMFYYGRMREARPELHEVFGGARLVEAFYQQFMFGGTKGEMPPGRQDRVAKAASMADEAVRTAVGEGRGTAWLEGAAGQIAGVLGVDSLLTIPAIVPRMGITRTAGTRRRGGRDDMRKDGGAGGAPEEVRAEYEEITAAQKREEASGILPAGVRRPPEDADESDIYDASLAAGLRSRFRRLRSGWREARGLTGDELDEESLAEGGPPFISDRKISIRARVMIMLDHSSSIAPMERGYKKAALGLCEVLAYLGARFSAYAFSSHDREVVCWEIKGEGAAWGRQAARRLAWIPASGPTPLGEVYQRMMPILEAGRPDVLLTLTDGEPSDPGSARRMISAVRRLGVGTAALGIGRGTAGAAAVASNLRGLGYERAVAAGRLEEVPARAVRILE
ncbi:MAG: VWA domain-containing protein [Nitrosopumilus sp.]|nr:VWA domain-containing protein [Nitrosopumilus sp.]MDA7943609.1 VWA domain-containing protein [Nitrosopumilus sp.]MDA7998872.1 VWA domain-containing protein [Nitrosopumilus sp.]